MKTKIIAVIIVLCLGLMVVPNIPTVSNVESEDVKYEITLKDNYWNFKSYPNTTNTYSPVIFNEIPNCTALSGKHDTSGYWYTYWPGLGLNENWTLKPGDGLFILTDQDTYWNITISVNASGNASGLTRGATYIIASANSTDDGKDSADYVCNYDSDEVEFQSANDNLTCGGKILILEGNYLFNNTLILDSYVTLQGMGWSSIIIACNGFGNKNVIEAEDKTNVVVKDLTVDGNFDNNPRAGTNDDQNGIEFKGTTLHFTMNNSTVDNVYVCDTPDNGIAVDNWCSDIVVMNSKVEDAHWHSIMYWKGIVRSKIINNFLIGGMDTKVEDIGGKCEFIDISHNTFLNNTLVILGGRNMVIDSNHMVNNVASGYAIQIVTGSSGEPVDNIVISNNILKSGQTYAIRFDAYNADEITNVIIIGNIIDGYDNRGIWFSTNQGQMKYFQITNNVMGQTAEMVGDTHRIQNNRIVGGTLFHSPGDLSGLYIEGNLGYVTENYGTTGAGTEIQVTHGLAGTPDQVLVTPLGNTSYFWVHTKTSTTFNITSQASVTFDWYAIYKP